MTRWGELVFHVLAHARESAHLAASAWDPAWVSFVARHAGSAAERPLDEDLEALGPFVRHHGPLVRLQRLAWLFDDVSRVVACSERPLSELRPTDVDRPELLADLTSPQMNTAVEILRAAAELEAEVYRSLPAAHAQPAAFGEALERMTLVAPHLSRCSVVPIRPLRLRGRVWGERIWTGQPCERLGPSVEHAAWQAAHEATVAEVMAAAQAAQSAQAMAGLEVRHDPLEHASVVLLASRAQRHGAGEAHGRWLKHLAKPPAVGLQTLPHPWRVLVDTLLEAPGSAVGERSRT